MTLNEAISKIYNFTDSRGLCGVRIEQFNESGVPVVIAGQVYDLEDLAEAFRVVRDHQGRDGRPPLRSRRGR